MSVCSCGNRYIIDCFVAYFLFIFFFFFFNDPATTEIYTLSLHDALPISLIQPPLACAAQRCTGSTYPVGTERHRSKRSEEHTSELQSRRDLVCRLLLAKKKKKHKKT